MSVEEKLNPVGRELLARENIDEVVERIEALSASVGTLMERSVDAGLKAAEQVSDDGVKVAGEFMSLGSVLRREAFALARRVSSEVSAVMGSQTRHG